MTFYLMCNTTEYRHSSCYLQQIQSQNFEQQTLGRFHLGTGPGRLNYLKIQTKTFILFFPVLMSIETQESLEICTNTTPSKSEF